MKLVACCVSKQDVTELWPHDWIPFFNLGSNAIASPRGTVERVRLVSTLRNQIMKRAISDCPLLTHVMMIDDYYLFGDYNRRAILDLIQYYIENNCQKDKEIIGGSTWIRVRMDTLLVKKRFYDTGTTPEATKINWNSTGVIKVNAVGACYIFPLEAWYKNGYQCDPTKFVPEHVSLCHGFPTFLNLDVKFWRHDRTDAIRPIRKALRVKFGRWKQRIQKSI